MKSASSSTRATALSWSASCAARERPAVLRSGRESPGYGLFVTGASFESRSAIPTAAKPSKPWGCRSKTLTPSPEPAGYCAGDCLVHASLSCSVLDLGLVQFWFGLGPRGWLASGSPGAAVCVTTLPYRLGPTCDDLAPRRRRRPHDRSTAGGI